MNERSSDSTTSVLLVTPTLFVADASIEPTTPTAEAVHLTVVETIQTSESSESTELSDVAKSIHALESSETQNFTAVPSAEKNVRAEDSLQSWLLFSLFLGCGAVVMFLSVWRAWKHQQRTCDQKKELHYHQGVFLRRIQSAAMLALIAILLPLGPVFFLKSLVGKIVFLLAILLLIFWMVALALADMLIARFHWQRLQDQCKLERLKLELAIRQQRTTTTEKTSSDKPSDSDQPNGSTKPSNTD